jgi:hypothetical protein
MYLSLSACRYHERICRNALEPPQTIIQTTSQDVKNQQDNVAFFTKLYQMKRMLSISHPSTHSFIHTYILIYRKAIPWRSHCEVLRIHFTNFYAWLSTFQGKRGSSFHNCTLTFGSPIKHNLFLSQIHNIYKHTGKSETCLFSNQECKTKVKSTSSELKEAKLEKQQVIHNLPTIFKFHTFISW